MTNKKKIVLGFVLSGAIMLAVGLLERHFHIAAYLSPEALRDWTARLRVWAPVAYMAAMVVTVVIRLPSLPLSSCSVLGRPIQPVPSPGLSPARQAGSVKGRRSLQPAVNGRRRPHQR